MLRVTLSPSDHEAVQALRRDRTLTPHERDRVDLMHKQDPVRAAQAAHTLTVFKKSAGRPAAPRPRRCVWLRAQPAAEERLLAKHDRITESQQEPRRLA